MTVGVSGDADGLWATDAAQLARIIGGAVSTVVPALIGADHLERLTRMREAMDGIDGGLAIVDGMEAANASDFAVRAVAQGIQGSNRDSSFHAEFADRLRAEAAWVRLALLIRTACPDDDDAKNKLMRKLMLRYGDDHKAAGDRLSEDLFMDRLIVDDSEPTHHLGAEAMEGASVVKSIAAVLRHVAMQEGTRSPGWEHAKRLLVVASNGALSLDRAHFELTMAHYSDLDPDCLPEELKRVLIRATLEIAIADGVITDEEKTRIVRVIRKLWGCSDLVARHMLATIIDALLSDHDPEKTAALQTLGLSDDATTADIREAYLALVRQHHPDLASPAERADATARAAEINAAYEYLMGATAT